MGSTEGNKKTSNSYCLLNIKMDEVEKTKVKDTPSSILKNSQQSSTTKQSSFPSKSTSDVILVKSSKEKEFRQSNLNKSSKEKEFRQSNLNKSSKEKEFRQSAKKQNADPNIPDRSYGDFYCPICDSHMNSDGMWDAHIMGKRHLKNIKKGDPDFKYEEVEEESSITDAIRSVKDAVVGLSYIQEIRRKEIGAPPLYTCFLCQATFAVVSMLIEHVISMKHRLNYIKENSPDDYELLEATHLKKGQKEPLVAEVASKLEQKFGSGFVIVKQERVKPSNPFSKRAFDSDSDDDDVRRKSKIQKHDEKGPSVWKAVGGYKKNNFKDFKDCRDIIEERKRHAYISDEEADMHKRKDSIKRPLNYSQSRKYRSPSPYFLESSKRERAYPGISSPSPPKDYYKSYSHPYRSPVPESLKITTHSSVNSTPSTSQAYPYPRVIQVEQKKSLSSQNYPSRIETNSNTDLLTEFVYSLPAEIFLQMVLLKLDNMEIKRIEELSLLSKVINEAQTVFCKKLSPEIETLVKQNMFRGAEGNFQKNLVTSPGTNQVVMPSGTNQVVMSPGINQVAGSSTESKGLQPRSDPCFIRDIISEAKRNNNPSPSVYQNVASHQSSHQNAAVSYSDSMYENVNSCFQNVNTSSPNTNYSYNNASSSTNSNIPGLTLAEENRQALPSYNAYQPYYPNQSSNYPHYT